jgi:threonine/homoserine/homoserine lactone efflux protein
MNPIEYGMQVIAISASGALAPGPLFITNILYGTHEGPRSGLKVAYGHTVVELPLIIMLSAGLFSTAIASQYASLLGLVGGIGVLGFATMQIFDVGRRGNSMNTIATGDRSAFIAGMTLSAFNPFFLIWWFTVGLKLIADSAAFGLIEGIVILFGFHAWMDYVWLVGTAYLASKGRFVLRSRYHPILLLVFAGVLVCYGISFILEAILNW